MRKIGEILVGARAISEKVRDDTLEYARVHKVSFGTAILETGGISEETLLRALSVQASAPPVSASDLASVPPDVIRLVPQKLAKKHSAVPFRKVGRTLYLAMARPGDAQGGDEIAFLTGFTVIRHVAITARLHVALERYYGILSAPRHKALATKLDGQKSHVEPVRLQARPAPQSDLPPAPRIASGFFRLPLSDGPSDPWTLPSESPEPVEPAAQDRVVIETLPAVQKEQDLLQPLEYTPETSIADEPLHIGPPEVSADLSSRLSRVEEKDEIADAILDSLKAKLDTVALFVVQEEKVIGWQARPQPAEPLRGFSIPFSEASVFTSLRNTTSVFAGPCPDNSANRRILDSIGVRFPAVICVVPVAVKGKTVLFLVGEAVGGEHALQIPLLKSYAAKAVIALEILALKNRLKRL